MRLQKDLKRVWTKAPYLLPSIPAVAATVAGCNGMMVWGNLLACVAAMAIFFTTLSLGGRQ